MPLLSNPRQERFAQRVASGEPPAQAYTAVGYAAKAAYTCGPRLLKIPEIRARVLELRRAAAQGSVSHAALDREFVLRELMDNALQAKRNHEWSASNRALELLGKELGMFDRADLPWDGDPSTLSDHQLAQLTRHMERLAYGDDTARLEAAKRQVLALAGGDLIELEPEPVGGGRLPPLSPRGLVQS